jgi:MOSC domain-containing protein YiiM
MILGDKATGSRPRTVSLCITAPGSNEATLVEELELRLSGVVGDRHATPSRQADARTPWHPPGLRIANTRQISMASLEECTAVARALEIAEIDAVALGANLMMEGLPQLSALAPATRFKFPSGATVFVTDQNLPCRNPGRHLARRYDRRELEFAFPQKAGGRRGLVGLIEREGLVRTGDEVTVIRPLAREAGC